MGRSLLKRIALIELSVSRTVRLKPTCPADARTRGLFGIWHWVRAQGPAGALHESRVSPEKVIDPWMIFDPKAVEVICVTLPKDHCVQVPWKYIKVCGYSDPFCKNLN